MAKQLNPKDEIKKNLKTKKIILGSKISLKNLRLGKLSVAFLASNTSQDVVDDFEYYSKISETQVTKLEIPNDELGTFCKKPFPISVIGLLK